MSNNLAASGAQVFPPDPQLPLTVLDAVPTTVVDLEYVHRVLHAINIQTLMVELCGFPGDHEDAGRRKIVREIALLNRTCGWVTIPLTGDQEEDVATYWGGIDPDSVYVRARPINRPRGPVHVCLDRPRLELLLLAHCFMCDLRVSDRSCPAAREAAVAEARAMLAADWPAALGRIAAGVFRGSQDQRLRQLGWLLDGPEPGLVVCRHCYHLVAPADPHLHLDREDEVAARRREYDALPRYSAHAACQVAHLTSRAAHGA